MKLARHIETVLDSRAIERFDNGHQVRPSVETPAERERLVVNQKEETAAVAVSSPLCELRRYGTGRPGSY